MSARRLIFLKIALLALLATHRTHSQAQGTINSLPIATTHEVLDEKIEDGDIITFSKERRGLVLTTEPYDQRIFGVVLMNPKILYRTGETGHPIVREGVTNVTATTINGAINAGDYLTSSRIPGKAQKATNFQGHILGVALTPLNEGSAETITFEGQDYKQGTIKVNLAIGPASPVFFLLQSGQGALGALDQIISALFMSFQEEQSGFVTIKYIIAGLIVAVVTIVSFRNFGQNITQGIESLGRNPLAKRQIQASIVMNIVLIVVSSIVSLLFSLALIRF